jgi:trehalose 6-phosphate phosphatase
MGTPRQQKSFAEKHKPEADSPPLPPSAIEEWAAFEKLLGGRRPIVFLDYDGTLTPIVPRPQDARLDGPMRTRLEELAGLTPTIILSGRERANVQQMVNLKSLYYAGSHGFDIEGPTGSSLTHTMGESFVEDIQAACAQLRPAIENIEGAILENKRYALAVHYRLVDENEVPKLSALIDQTAARIPRLRKTGGKKIFELRPAIDWDKGKALRWLLEHLNLGKDIFPIYIGDDETDEDAFRELLSFGAGIVVLDESRPTQARFALKNVGEVAEFLLRLNRYCHAHAWPPLGSERIKGETTQTASVPGED